MTSFKLPWLIGLTLLAVIAGIVLAVTQSGGELLPYILYGFGGFIFGAILLVALKERVSWKRGVSGILVLGVARIVAIFFASVLVNLVFGRQLLDDGDLYWLAEVIWVVLTLMGLRLWRVNYSLLSCALVICISFVIVFILIQEWRAQDPEFSSDNVYFRIIVPLCWAGVAFGIVLLEMKSCFKHRGMSFSVQGIRPMLVGLIPVFVMGAIIILNPFQSDCDVAADLEKQMKKDLKAYQKSLDDMRSTYVILGFEYEFNVSVMGVLVDDDVAKVASRLSELENEIAGISEDEESCSALLALTKKQVDTHKEKLDLVLEKLEKSVTEKLESRRR